MIKEERKNSLKFKCVFNLDDNGCYQVEEELGTMKIKKDSLIVEIESLSILTEKVISLEIIAVGYEDIENTYKKFILLEHELAIHTGFVTKNVIDNMYYNNIVNKDALNTIIINAIDIVDKKHFYNKR